MGLRESAFGSDIDYSMLVKMYGDDPKPDTRYSPGECIGCQTVGITGHPNPRHISTSHVERQNLTMRMGMRRFTRLTNAFSKKVENHVAMVAIHFLHYNFARIHKTLRVTPAMAAGLSDHVWSLEERPTWQNETRRKRGDKESKQCSRYSHGQRSRKKRPGTGLSQYRRDFGQPSPRPPFSS